MTLTKRIASLRSERGWTLRYLRGQIESQTGHLMSFSYLSKLEKGDVSPTIDTLMRIAAAYNMTVQELLNPVRLDAREAQKR